MYSWRSFSTCVLVLALIAECKGAVIPIRETEESTNQAVENRKHQLCVMTSVQTVIEFHSLIDEITEDMDILQKTRTLNLLSKRKLIQKKGLSKLQNLLDNLLPGSGWSLILQRIDGIENFNRTWDEYRRGFGRFDADFFLGLDKIYNLTSAQRYELLVLLELGNGTKQYAQYDNFKIADNTDLYRLSLGEFSGNVMADNLSMHTREPFSTYNSDTDDSLGNCGAENGGGFWYTGCGPV